jgi:hypothetical protein
MLARRFTRTPLLTGVLAPIAGLVFFLWKAYDLGESCGYREGSALPNFPMGVAVPVLVGVPIVLTAARAFGEGRTRRRVVALALLSGVLAGAAVGAAELAFYLSRHCYA